MYIRDKFNKFSFECHTVQKKKRQQFAVFSFRLLLCVLFLSKYVFLISLYYFANPFFLSLF